MRARFFTLVSLLAVPYAPAVQAQAQKYPPLSEYMMARDAEIALAKSAAPEQISARATVKILTASGYEVAEQGNNGFVCLVMRGWGAPSFTAVEERLLVYDSKIRAPICFDCRSAPSWPRGWRWPGSGCGRSCGSARARCSR